LATGKEPPTAAVPMNNESLALIHNYNLLNEDDRKIVNEFVSIMKKHRRKKQPS